jgi:hypothetical protein
LRVIVAGMLLFGVEKRGCSDVEGETGSEAELPPHMTRVVQAIQNRQELAPVTSLSGTIQ